ncbi:MAG: GWxTD domain-containing protein [Bacteroidota bacterium]
MRVLLLSVALAASVSAQDAPEAGASEAVGGPLAEARAALAAGDSARAEAIAARHYRADRLRRDAEAEGLHRIRLAMHLAGFGLDSFLPRTFRQQQITDVAERLLAMNPADTLAIRVLSEDAVHTALTLTDRVNAGATSFPTASGAPASFVSPREVRIRTARSRFDMDAREAMTPNLDGSAQAAAAKRRLAGLLETWRREAPTDRRPYRYALTVGALDAAWDDVLATAEAMRDAFRDDPEAGLALGLAQFRLGEATASAATFAEALAPLEAGLRARYEDLGPLLTPEERDAYAADSAAFATAYWAAADPRRLTPANERRAEHRARVVEADLLFGRDAADLFAPAPWPPRGAETDRGRIWVRYGRPDRITQFTVSADAVPTYGGRGPYAIWDYDGFRFVFGYNQERGAYLTFSPQARAFTDRRTRSSAQNDDYVAQDRRMQRDDPTQTQVRPDVEVPVLVSRFRRSDGSTEAVVAYGAAVEDLEDAEAGVFALAEGATVAQAPGRLGGGGRTLRTEAGALATGAATVPLAGADALRAEVAVGDTWGASDVSVAPLGGGFGLSDLLLAASVDEGTGGSVVRDGLSITPVPLGVFRVGDPVHVYVEAYGLAVEDGRTRYTVEASLVPAARRGGLIGRIFGRGQRPAVSVAADEEGSRATEAAHRVIDTADQRPGTYTLRLTVTDRATGEAASAERVVTLE